MKRKDVIKRLEANGWYLKRNGGNYDIYWNDEVRRPVPVKRHSEIPDREAQMILSKRGWNDPGGGMTDDLLSHPVEAL